MQRRIHHHHNLSTFWRPFTCLGNHFCGCQNMIHQSFWLWIFRCFRLFKIVKDQLLRLQSDGFQHFLRFAQREQQIFHSWQRILTHLLLQIIPIPLTSHATSMMPQQRHFHMHQHRRTLISHKFDGLLHLIVTLHKITSVDA